MPASACPPGRSACSRVLPPTSEERPKADPGASFEQAMTEVKTGAARREDAFSKAFERTRNLDDLLQKKFEEAKRKAANEPGKKPRNPLDFD